MRTITATLALATVALTFAAAGGAGVRASSTVTLSGVVGPGFTISLKARGKTVKVLAPTKYTFTIVDKSTVHNFHLTGPGVNRKTSVGGTGTTHWTLTLRVGTYHFVCDPHASFMKGSFTVRTP
jgi:plastocyanin